MNIDMNALLEEIETYTDLLPTSGNSVSKSDAEDRATKFLVISSKLLNARFLANEDKIKAISIAKSIFAQVTREADGKNVTEKKLNAEANSDYQEAREYLEKIENKVDFFKTYINIFNDAHVFYRQLSKEYN